MKPGHCADPGKPTYPRASEVTEALQISFAELSPNPQKDNFREERVTLTHRFREFMAALPRVLEKNIVVVLAYGGGASSPQSRHKVEGDGGG